MLFLLVLFLWKCDCDGVGEVGFYGFGDLIKKLLRSFVELNRVCMYEIEFFDLEIFYCVFVSVIFKIGRVGEINFKDDIFVFEFDRWRVIVWEC